MDSVKEVDTAVKQLINPIVASFIVTFVLIYADEIRIPFEHHKFFDNQIFKAVILFIIISYFTRQPTMSLGIALLLMVGFKFVKKAHPEEKIEQFQPLSSTLPLVFAYPAGDEPVVDHVFDHVVVDEEQSATRAGFAKEELMYKQKDFSQFLTILPNDSFPVVDEQESVQKPSKSQPLFK